MNSAERAAALLREVDSDLDRGDQPDASVLGEIAGLLDLLRASAAEQPASRPVTHYLWAQWHQSRARMLRDVGEAGAAIAEMEQTLTYVDGVGFRLHLADLFRLRYTLTYSREDLARAIEELRGLAGTNDEQHRGQVLLWLGTFLHAQFRCDLDEGRDPDPGRLDEIESSFERSLDLTGAHADAMLGLARVRSLRAVTTPADHSRDPEADEEEAIRLYEQVATRNPEAAFELALVWNLRFARSGDALARAEALRWLRRCENAPGLPVETAELAELHGGLWLSLARDDRAELPGVIEYLTGVFEAEPEPGSVGRVLVDAHWLAGDAVGLVRVTERLGRLDRLVRAYRAIAVASLALRGRAGLAEAERLLRESTRTPCRLRWEKQVSLALLAAVCAGGTGMPESLAASVVGEGCEQEVAGELLAWLEEHENPGADWLCARAALAYALANDPEARMAALTATAVARAVLSASGEPDVLDLELLVQQAHLTLMEGEQSNDSRVEMRAAALLEEFLGRADEHHPLRNEALGFYGITLSHVRAWGGTTPVPLSDVVAALHAACADTTIEPIFRTTFLVHLVRVQLMQTIQERVDHYTELIGHCREAVGLAEEGSFEHEDALMMLALVLFNRFDDHGEDHDLEVALQHLRTARASRFARGVDVADVDYLALRAEALLTRDFSSAVLPPAGVYERFAVLEGSGWTEISVVEERISLASTLMRHASHARDPEMLGDALERLESAMEDVEAGSMWQYPLITTALESWTDSALAMGDTARFLDGIARLEAIRDDTATPDGHRASAAFLVALQWLRRHGLTGSTADLDEALRQYARVEHASLFGADRTGVLDHFADSCWNLVSQGYGEAALSIGFDSLRQRARNVVRQSGGRHAAQHAADAAARGLGVALRCAEAGEFGRAVEAVEWGRGLVLHSATLTSGVAACLRESGHPDLADEWEREPGEDLSLAPSGLRRRVLSALGDDLHALTPPPVEEISAALRALDAFALVHLVPGRDGHRGRALLTTAHGTVEQVLLPLLDDGPDSEVGRYLAMADQARRKALPALCRWAWDAMKPLLSGVSRGTTWFVLVPTGALGVVPWHAAAGDGRAAVREAGFTYAASARQLCELARRERRPVGESPVVVSDPAGTLVAVQYEAEFLHGLFPHALFYGQTGPGVPVHGAGTPDEVLAGSGASLQHLGCHARAGTTLATSALQLAGADLSVERMLRHAARRDGAAGGLVVLAACESDLTTGLHDEVLTLAAAYVAAGATGVVGTKWEVGDVESAVLMCAFYDFVARQDMRPRDALRAVQLWALDPGRAVPAGVARHLAELGRSAVLADPVHWAAFAHHGW